jgi:hypothetical protein
MSRPQVTIVRDGASNPAMLPQPSESGRSRAEAAYARTVLMLMTATVTLACYDGYVLLTHMPA